MMEIFVLGMLILFAFIGVFTMFYKKNTCPDCGFLKACPKHNDILDKEDQNG
jgi:hypothetical protein